MNNGASGLDDLWDGIRMNDPSINEVHIPVCNHSQVDSMVKALQENTTVTSLILQVSEENLDTDASFTLLLQYLKQCTSIRAVEFVNASVHLWRREQETQLLQALMKNLTMELVHFRSRASILSNNLITVLEAKAHCIKHLHIERIYPDVGDDVDSSMRRLAQAVASLRVLESVNIRFPASQYMRLMLEKMSAQPSLRKLSVTDWDDCDTCPDNVRAVSALLQSKVRLETLELTCF
jgi:predicted transcriptional regulator